MTEEEAKTKWCPFYRVSVAGSEGGTADNRPPNGENVKHPDGSYTWRTFGIYPTACCIGSACMAWRWDRPQEIDEPIASDDGHCGLAARP